MLGKCCTTFTLPQMPMYRAFEGCQGKCIAFFAMDEVMRNSMRMDGEFDRN